MIKSAQNSFWKADIFPSSCEHTCTFMYGITARSLSGLLKAKVDADMYVPSILHAQWFLKAKYRGEVFHDPFLWKCANPVCIMWRKEFSAYGRHSVHNKTEGWFTKKDAPQLFYQPVAVVDMVQKRYLSWSSWLTFIRITQTNAHTIFHMWFWH